MSAKRGKEFLFNNFVRDMKTAKYNALFCLSKKILLENTKLGNLYIKQVFLMQLRLRRS